MDFPAVLADINEIVSSAWPDIPGMARAQGDTRPIQRMTTVQDLTEPFVDRINKKTFALPAVVVKIGTENHDGQWGVRSRTYAVPITIHYIDAQGVGQPAIHAKLVALRAAFESADANGTIASFQMGPDLGNIDTSDDSEVNQRLRDQTTLQVIGGSLTYNPGVLVH